MTAKRIRFGDDARMPLVRGIQIVAQALGVTIGPKGRYVVVSGSANAPEITREGDRIARAISLADPSERAGAELFKSAIGGVASAVGDGTTTAAVLAMTILREGRKALAAGLAPSGIRRGIELAVEMVVGEIQARARMLELGGEITAGTGIPGLRAAAASADRKGFFKALRSELGASLSRVRAADPLSRFLRSLQLHPIEAFDPLPSGYWSQGRRAGLSEEQVSAIADRMFEFRDRLLKGLPTDSSSDAKVYVSYTQLAQIAANAAHGDAQIGDLVARAVGLVGRHGLISVDAATGQTMQLQLLPGAQFGRGYVSAQFVTDATTSKAELRSAYVLLHEGVISTAAQLIPVLELVLAEKRALLIVADDINGEALTTLVINKLRSVLAVVAVRSPEFGNLRIEMLEDLAVLTGGIVVGEGIGIRLEDVRLDMLGRAAQVTVEQESTQIVGGEGAPDKIEARRALLSAQAADPVLRAERGAIRARLAGLFNSAVVIRSGGTTDLETNERAGRLQAAIRAAEAAVEEGILPGGGAALAHASGVLAGVSGATLDERAGIEAVRRAIEAPLQRIVTNAGQEAKFVAEEVHAGDDAWGYDAEADCQADLILGGVIDAAKVVRRALQDAASLAGLMLTADVLVVGSQASDPDDVAQASQ